MAHHIAPPQVAARSRGRSIAMRFFDSLRCGLSTEFARHFLVGSLVGGCLMAILYQTLATFGADLVVVSAMTIAGGLSFCVGTSTAGCTQIDRRLDAVAHLGLAIAVVAFGLLTPLSFGIFEWAGLDVLQQLGMRLLVSILAIGLVLVIPVAAVGRLAESCRLNATTPQSSIGPFLLGIAGGTVVCVALASVAQRFDIVVWMLVLGQLGIGVRLVAWAPPSRNADQETERLPATSGLQALLSVVAATTVGLLTAGLWRVLQQLMPTTTGLVFVANAMIAFGAGLLPTIQRSIRETARRKVAACVLCLASVCSIGLVASFDFLVRLCLTANAHISDTWLLVLARTGITALMLLPCGLACGAILAGFGPSKTGTSRGGSLQLTLVSILTGLIAGRWLIAGGWAIVELLTIASAALTLIGVASVFWRETNVRTDSPSNHARPSIAPRLFVFTLFRSPWFPRCLSVAAAGCVVVSPWLLAGYSPDVASRRLFNTQVFAAFRNGTDFAELDGLDDARLVETRECRAGTLTVWSTRGFHRQLRQDGIPLSAVSTNTRICPHQPAEILATVIPMVLHESPRSVLLLGTAGGVPVTTALEFPIHSLRWSDADESRVALIRESLWTRSNVVEAAAATVAPDSTADAPLPFLTVGEIAPVDSRSSTAAGSFNDDRLDFVSLPAEQMVVIEQGVYDVVLSFPESAALLAGTGQYTREFYRRAAERLTRDGLFCQRFQTADFGPQPTRELLHTLGQAFSHVAAIESAPGEFVMVGTNSEKGLKRDGLMERLQSPHVATVLQDIGWDWSIALKLNSVHGAAAQEYLTESAPTPNTAANGRFAFALAPEVMRWGNKSLELRTEFGPYAHALSTWFRVDEIRPEIERRVAEVVTQRKLMAERPDEPFAYRAKLRSQLTSKPRSAIQRISLESGDDRMHPEDKRRMRYFTALDEAQKDGSPQALNRLVSFAWPYDPLISYFVHSEIAELSEQQSERDFRFELNHRLHTVNFADARDRSVAVIADAIKLIVEHPETIPDVKERWDITNGLLQVMLHRWEARKQHRPTSAIRESTRIDGNLAALMAALDAMDQWRDAAGVTEHMWDTRRRWIEQTLLRPLRRYQATLEPHQHRQQMLKRMKEARVTAKNDLQESATDS
ncbi:MAG: hypothetical protein O3A00_08180 [Planctomycetota bacterium]|nr:hypothetical protein [Planctomycetota bacterium]